MRTLLLSALKSSFIYLFVNKDELSAVLFNPASSHLYCDTTNARLQVGDEAPNAFLHPVSPAASLTAASAAAPNATTTVGLHDLLVLQGRSKPLVVVAGSYT